MTIEERAKEWSKHYIGKSRQSITHIAYEKGATDQQKIDIEKANQWLKDYMHSGKDDIAKAMTYGFLTDFVMAMEE